MNLPPPRGRPSVPAADLGGPRCTSAVLAPGAVGSALRCRLALGHDEVRYAGDPVHEAEGVAGLLIRWRYLDELDADPTAARRLRRYPSILEVAAADAEPLVTHGATGYRPRQYVPPGDRPYPQLRLVV